MVLIKSVLPPVIVFIILILILIFILVLLAMRVVLLVLVALLALLVLLLLLFLNQEHALVSLTASPVKLRVGLGTGAKSGHQLTLLIGHQVAVEVDGLEVGQVGRDGVVVDGEAACPLAQVLVGLAVYILHHVVFDGDLVALDVKELSVPGTKGRDGNAELVAGSGEANPDTG